MTQTQPPGLSIQDKAIEGNYLDRIRTLEQENSQNKAMIITLSDRIDALLASSVQYPSTPADYTVSVAVRRTINTGDTLANVVDAIGTIANDLIALRLFQ